MFVYIKVVLLDCKSSTVKFAAIALCFSIQIYIIAQLSYLNEEMLSVL